METEMKGIEKMGSEGLTCVVYDVEIAKEVHTVERGWDNPGGMGFASAVAYDYLTDQYHFFLHEVGKGGLLNLLQDRIVATFNGVKFDSRVILGNLRGTDFVSDGMVLITGTRICGERSPESGDVLNTIRTAEWMELDLLLRYVQSRFGCASVLEAEKLLGDKTIHDGTFGLDGLAEGTLGLKKIGHGSKAPVLYQQERYDELFAYNLHDVRLTRKLLEAVRKSGNLTDSTGRNVQIDLGGFWKWEKSA